MLCRLYHRLTKWFLILNFISAFALNARAFDFTNPEEVSMKAAEILEELKPENIFKAITSGFSSYISQLSTFFYLCLTVVLITALISAINKEGTANTGFEFAAICLTIIIIFHPVTLCFSKTQEHIEAISGFMVSFIPTGVLLHTASGNTLSASLLSSTLGSVIAILQLICMSLLIPITKACLCLNTVNSLHSNPMVESLCSALKSVGLWICGLAFTVFTGLLSLQTVLQSCGDNIAMKGLRYSAAKLIPVAGGMISESLKTVVSGMKYIKNITGISGILFIVYALIPPLCYIVSTKLCLTFLSFSSRICNLTKIRTFFDNTQSIINILLALLLASSVFFIIVLSLFMATNVSV